MPILTPEERVGTVIAGKYRLDRILAQGGMGTVFGGQHEWTHRPVAVKLLNYEHARNPDIVQRFLQEARAAATLSHPNVVDVLDMGEDHDGTVYMVLELLEGRTLRARLREAGRIEQTELLAILGPVMDALAVAHRRGVVHRDLKPDNIFLADVEDGAMVPKLLDFGIAKVRDGDSAATGTGVMIGTPQYMAPEQVRGERDVGAPADVWSMGVLIYVALSGRLPFSGDAAATILAKVLTERPPALRVIAPHVSSAVADVVDRALSADPNARFADMAEMLAALQRAVDMPAQLGASAGGGEWSELPTDVTLATPAPSFADPAELPMVKTVQLDIADLDPEPSQPAASPEPSSTPFTWGTTSEPSLRVGPTRGGMWLAIGAIGLISIAVGAGSVVWLAGGDEAAAPRPLAAPRAVSATEGEDTPIATPPEGDDALATDATPIDSPSEDDQAPPLPGAMASSGDDAAGDETSDDDASDDDASDDDASDGDATDEHPTETAGAAREPDEARTTVTPAPPRAARPPRSREPRPQRGTRGALILR